MTFEPDARSIIMNVRTVNPPRTFTGGEIRGVARARRTRLAAGLSVTAVLTATACLMFGLILNSPGGPATASKVGVAQAPGSAHGGVGLPTDRWRSGQPGLFALRTGQLHIVRTSAGVCAWLGPQRRNFLWPAGFSARFNPNEIVDSRGSVVAKEGDRVSVAGGLGSVAPKDRTCADAASGFYITSQIATLNP